MIAPLWQAARQHEGAPGQLHRAFLGVTLRYFEPRDDGGALRLPPPTGCRRPRSAPPATGQAIDGFSHAGAVWYPASAMKFVQYRRPDARDCKIDWEARAQVSEEVRRALHPHDVDALHAGRLRRPFLFQPPVLGRRSRHGAVKHPWPEPVHHERGALVFAYADESCFFIEAPDAGP